MNANAFELIWALTFAAVLFYAVRVRRRAVDVNRARIQHGENGLRQITAIARVRRGWIYVILSAIGLFVGAIAFLTEPTDTTRVLFSVTIGVGMPAAIFVLVRGDDRENELISAYRPPDGSPMGRRRDDRPL